MKYLLIFILPVFSDAFAQNTTFKEIKLKPNPKFYKTNEATIIYPIIETNTKQIDKLINAQIKEDVLDSDNGKQSIKNILIEHINDGLINLSYQVTYKKNGILSMNIYSEGCGAHCSSWETYFNFDLKTGKKIAITDLIIESKIDSFQKIVFTDKIKALTEYKIEEINNLTNKYIDSVTYNWALEQVDSNCVKTIQIGNFSLSNQNLEIIDVCEFPFAIRSQQPTYELKYLYKFISTFLKPTFQRRLLNRGIH